MPPLLGFVLLWSNMPATQALSGLLGSWPEILGGDVTQNPFYRWSMGTQGVGHSLALMRKSILWYGLLLAPPAALGLLLRRPGRHRFWLSAATFVVIAGFLAWWPVWWPATVGLLPVAMLLLGLWLATGLIRRRRLDEAASRRILALALVLFALIALLKILFLARTYHYGFALAMPATLLAIVALLDWIPARIERAGGYGGPLRAATLAVCAFFVLGHLNETRHYFALKTETVAASRDAFRADERGRQVNEMLELIERNVGPDETLAVLPAGVMLNYLARRAAPTPYIYFMPSDLRMHGEQQVLARFRATPPDFVVLVHKDTSEFGARFFGRDYGRALHDWIRLHYRVAGQVGAPPLRDERFGMTLLERADSGFNLDDLKPGSASAEE